MKLYHNVSFIRVFCIIHSFMGHWEAAVFIALPTAATEASAAEPLAFVKKLY